MAPNSPAELTLRKQALLLESSLNRLALQGDFALLRRDAERALRPASFFSGGAALASLIAPAAAGLFSSGTGGGWLRNLGTAVRLGAAAVGWWRRLRSERPPAGDKRR